MQICPIYELYEREHKKGTPDSKVKFILWFSVEVTPNSIKYLGILRNNKKISDLYFV